MQLVLNGEGEFTPAHVVGATTVFGPQAFDITFEVTPTGGTTETVSNTSLKPNVHGDLSPGSFDVTQFFPDGTSHFFGTATGFFNAGVAVATDEHQARRTGLYLACL